MQGINSVSMRSGQIQGLVSYEASPSPRGPGELDVKGYVEKLQDSLKNAQMELKDYKK